jgi:hypothetical protein
MVFGSSDKYDFDLHFDLNLNKYLDDNVIKDAYGRFITERNSYQ